ncbi:DUF416 family protein [Roseofilum sp. Guam]|uniref:DUF416 family protein n=1 Tax=Roseofilum sp. Guam TaxID=2821502 RepID=UPI001B28BEB5|nr:DUF416 family protein [Roseofilum sp. Guam]MBP0029423.1 DUF416 family protein [Roseofilum sp. Guam]
MNLELFNLSELNTVLDELPPLHRLAFAASMCERMLPIYDVFCQQEKWGNPQVLREALDEAWRILQAQTPDIPKINQLQRQMDEIAPDADNCRFSRFIFEAQMACSVIDLILEINLNIDSQKVVKIAEYITDTIDSFLTLEKDTDDPDWPAKPLEEQRQYIANHRLAKQEIAKQKEDLQRLKEAKILDTEILEWLRTSYKNEGKTIIDLS